MKLPRSVIELLLPQARLDVNVAFSSEIQDPILRKCHEWTQYLLNRLDLYLPFYPFRLDTIKEYWGRIIDVSVGFISVGSVGEKQQTFKVVEGFVFGIQILVKGDKNKPIELFESNFGDVVQVPIVLKFGDIELHSLPHPTQGTSACWVKSTTQSLWNQGVLTCGHVLSHLQIGSTVSLQTVTGAIFSGSLADIGHSCIDAAIVSVSASTWPIGTSPMSVVHPLIPGSPVDLKLKGGTVSGSLLSISGHNTYYGPQVSHRVYIDCHGAQGDSGSLVAEPVRGGIGLYMGTIPGANNSQEGFCQSLVQVSRYFCIDFYL